MRHHVPTPDRALSTEFGLLLTLCVSLLSVAMAKKKPTASIRSFGIYRDWDPESKGLPDIQEFTTRIPAIVGIEFGFIVNIQGAKNCAIGYCIYHPNILDAEGIPRPPFDGTVYAKTNEWDFYLGDTIWLPLDDKIGSWRMTVSIEEHVVAEKTFDVRLGDDPS